ncbi:tRNA (adenosine(37)-N6)-dimethylallyltransferase MiaA [Pacificimonas sp. ICDLI1SI03]
MKTSDKQMVAVIAGPTATGKSARALELARSRNGVIINADASQLYRDLRILSARPSPHEEAAAPHRLYGARDGASPASAAEWADMAKEEIAAAHAAGCLPILVGGTGLYLKVLFDGIAPVPNIRADIRDEVRALSTGDLAAALAREDPIMAGRLRPSDTQRLARALEVRRSSGRSLADWQEETAGGIRAEVEAEVHLIDLPRADLFARCNTRFDAMVQAGGMEEVRALAERQLSPDAPVMKAIGVPPLLAYLRGEVALDEAVDQAKQDTRRYAKRQQTWFRTQGPKLNSAPAR